MAMRWKMGERNRGIMNTFPRSHWLRDGDKKFACVSSKDRCGSQWYWVAGWGSGIPHINTCDNPVATVDEAKAAAMAYVKDNIVHLPNE